ncbi:MAG: response regulator, partial [Oscillospiraceae bacterium]|nr:response regulator [Oscillospiraceae bacterium]
MYTCHIVFYCIGQQQDIFDRFRDIPPLEPFTHGFLTSETPDASLAAQADVILADLRELDAAEVLPALSAAKKDAAQLIALAKAVPDPLLPLLTDLWPLPADSGELCFRFTRWQEDAKRRADLWETSSFLETVINSSPNLVWFKAEDGTHEKVNDSFCRTVNKTREQILGRSHTYVWDMDEADPTCVASDVDVMSSGRTRVFEERIHTADSEYLLSTYKSPLYDLDGSVMGTVGVAMDMTRVRSYEEALMKRNEVLENLFTTMDCGVISHTVDGSKVLSINQAALNILDYDSLEELESAGFDVVAASVLEEDQSKVRASIQSLHEAGESTTVEYRVLHKDGSLIHVICNIKLVEENGQWFYQRSLLDCTAQRLREEARQFQMDQELQYQRHLFDVLSTHLSNNTDDVYIMLAAGAEQVEYASPNLERVLGMTKQEMQEGLHDFLQIPDASGRSITEEELRALQPGQSIEPREIKRVNTRTGEQKWFHETIYCSDLQGDRKLAFYISDRTRERKTMDALSEALEMAKMASQAKSSFLSSVSHDIRTPMNAIMGFITLLREEAGDKERVLEYTQRIDAASQHLLGLINNVLDLNKIESGTTALNLSEMDLAEIIEEINAIIRPQTKAKDQTFNIQVKGLVHEYLVGDRVRINQILINLLSNAVKYTQKGGSIEMTVTELPQAQPDYCRIRFVVTDNGQGMSEAYQKVIFDPFTREQETLTSQTEGTGLGMPITKSLVELMGGSISLQSKIGKGTTFTVELELRIQAQATDPKFWADHQIRRMLVVDDDEDICASVVRSMSKTGVKVVYRTDGVAAVEEICRARDGGQPYDLILLDWKMPGISGLETARLIRERHVDDVPIMIFTAYDWEEIEKEAAQVHINHFLPKPFFLSNFQDALRRVNNAAKPAGAAPKNPVDGKHVLVVDDIEVNRMILTKILSTLGAQCEIAVNGQEAVDKFTASEPGTFDLIMMDIQMPIMDGYSAARAIRASSHPEAQSIAVVPMTANALVDDVLSLIHI